MNTWAPTWLDRWVSACWNSLQCSPAPQAEERRANGELGAWSCRAALLLPFEAAKETRKLHF